MSTGSNLLGEEFELPTDGRHGVVEDASYHYSTLQSDRPPLRHIDKYIRPGCPCVSKRVTVALLTCMGFIVMFGMRCNISLAGAQSEEMTNPYMPMEYAVFLGFLISQVPAGLLATKYPANKLFGGAIGMLSVLNLLVPSAWMLGPSIIIPVRFLQGLLEGVTFPACYGMLRYWAPPLERSRLSTLAFCGIYVGILLAMPISGEIIIRFGWKAPFYLYGCLGIVWYLTWLWLVFEKPNKHTTIDAEELRYIENSLEDALSNNTRTTIASTPWKAILTSLPVWAIFIANFCNAWNYYLLVVFQAAYYNDVYWIFIENIYIIKELPPLMAIVVAIGGVLSDYLRKQGILTTTQVRKLFNCGAFGMQATFFLIVAFSNSSSQTIIALTFGVAFSGFAISGFHVNPLDIAPKYSSILMGMSNFIGMIAVCICTIGVIEFIDKEQVVESSKHAFLLAAAIQYLGAIFYGIFASGELQPWAGPYKAEEENQTNPLHIVRQKKKWPTITILIVFSAVCLFSLGLTIYMYPRF